MQHITTATRDRGSNVLAALCSFIFPGLGQLFQGRIFAAIVWVISFALGLAFFVLPAIVVWLLNVVDAANYGTDAPIK